MNQFLQCLFNENLLGTFIKDSDDIDFLKTLNDVFIEEKESKQGKLNKIPYFNWFVILNRRKTCIKFIKN